jgi:hypothetical protein
MERGPGIHKIVDAVKKFDNEIQKDRHAQAKQEYPQKCCNQITIDNSQGGEITLPVRCELHFRIFLR